MAFPPVRGGFAFFSFAFCDGFNMGERESEREEGGKALVAPTPFLLWRTHSGALALAEAVAWRQT